MANSNIDVQELTGESFSHSLLLQMLAEGLYADINFRVQGGTVKAHRSVLAAASPVFREMFQQTEDPCTVSLPDMTLESSQLFLVLLYMSNEERGHKLPDINKAVGKHFVSMIDAAHKFQVEDRLYEVLQHNLLRHLTPENCWEFYHKCEDLALISDYDYAELCLTYVIRNRGVAMTSETALLEMQRNPKVLRRCIIDVLSKELQCDLCCPLMRKRTRLTAQVHGH